MYKSAHSSNHAEFPRLAERLGEDPGRWLDDLDALTPTVDSLIRGFEDLERALNWRYVAMRCECDGAVRDRIDQRIRQLRQRPAARRMAPVLRELYHAAPQERSAIRDRVLGREDVDRADAKVVAGLCGTLAARQPASEPEMVDESGSQPDTESSTTDDDADDDAGREDMRLSRAREIVASMDRDRVNSLLQLEQASDCPRENVLQALTERRDEFSTSQTEVANA